jgi:hypothetical protein
MTSKLSSVSIHQTKQGNQAKLLFRAHWCSFVPCTTLFSTLHGLNNSLSVGPSSRHRTD